MNNSQPVSSVPDGSLGVAVVGAGYWGVNYVRVLSELPEARLVAICEPRRERLAEVGGRFPGVDLVADLDELLRRDDIDAVVVATGATTHHAVTSRVLAAGKHALVEKPLATTVAEGADLVRLARERRRVLMVGHTFLFNPAVVKTKSYIDDGALGHIYYLYARRTNLGPVRHDVNALWDLAPHDVSIFNHLLDATPEWVSATGARLLRNAREDVGFITLGYPGGVIGNIHVSWADPNKVRELVVVGSEKRLLFDDVNATEPLRLFEKSLAVGEDELDSGFPLEIRDGDIISPRVAASEPLKNQTRHFLACVRDGRTPATPGEDGIAVVAVMEAIHRSLVKNGAPVSVTTATPEDLAAASSWSSPVPAVPKVPFVDLRAQYAELRDDVHAAIDGVLERGDFILGGAVDAFEGAFADYCETRFAVGVDSGLSALEIGLRAVGVGPGDEVITAANSFVASALAISGVGATPVLVDVDESTSNLDMARVEAAISPRTKAIVPVHLYGQPADMTALLELAERHGLKVVEDACQAHGARHLGRRVGGLGHCAAFSFYPAKNLGAYGDAGALVTNDPEIDAYARSYRNYGSSVKYRHELAGSNRRLDTLQAAVLGVKLPRLDGWNAARRAAARRYGELLHGSGLILPSEAPGMEHVFHLYVVRTPDRDGLLAHLAAAGIGAGVHYPLPIHLQPAYRHLGYVEGDFPVTERLAREILSLPMYAELPETFQLRVAEAVLSFGALQRTATSAPPADPQVVAERR